MCKIVGELWSRSWLLLQTHPPTQILRNLSNTCKNMGMDAYTLKLSFLLLRDSVSESPRCLRIFWTQFFSTVESNRPICPNILTGDLSSQNKVLNMAGTCINTLIDAHFKGGRAL